MSQNASTDWAKIPVKLQHQFFVHAEREAMRLKRRLNRQKELLKQLHGELPFRPIPESNAWKRWRIACIDGSYSPNLSERLGARYGVYAAGYMIFEGSRLVDEAYQSDQLSHGQTGGPEATEILLGLLTTRLEREMARRCLEKKSPDLIILDGPFYGFRVRAKYLPQTAKVPRFGTVESLIKYVREISTTLQSSGKCVGIVKRIRTEAIDGWLKKENRPRTRMNDKAILAATMPANQWFSYADLFGGSTSAYNIFSNYARRKYILGQTGLQEARKEVERRMKETLLVEDPYIALDNPRYFVRCNKTAPPFCLETPKNMPLEAILSYFQANQNPATGLPFPLDLIDSNVGLPTGFTKEFVEEVEALLIKDPELQDVDLANHFQPLNPQKED